MSSCYLCKFFFLKFFDNTKLQKVKACMKVKMAHQLLKEPGGDCVRDLILSPNWLPISAVVKVSDSGWKSAGHPPLTQSKSTHTAV